MKPWLFESGLAAASVAAWFGLFALMLLVTRPRRITPGPAAQDLPPESPAIASLLGNGWDLTEDAAESTLLDLAGRGYFEFRQPDNDPFHTTIHIGQTKPTGLTRYEQRVFDRVSGLAVAGVVPLTALTFRDEKMATSWWKRFKAEVVADARSAGLSQRRFSSGVRTVLGFGAVLADAGIIIAVIHYANRQPPSTNSDDDPYGLIVPAIIFPLAILIGFAFAYVGERDTAAGREVAARWLGVKAWLRAHPAFSDLPPASVMVWGRYIGYGAALGASRVASTVIDMGMGNRRRVWSSYGGRWRQVRVSYPHFWHRYGQRARDLTKRSVLCLAAGIALVGWWRRGVAKVAAINFDPNPVTGHATVIGTVGYAIGLILGVYGAYTLLRVVVDALTQQEITGQVLWKRVWRSQSGGENEPARPWLYYLAIDDGKTDRTRAWGLPVTVHGGYDPGDTVTVTIRRWTRRIVAAKVVERGTSGHYVSTADANKAQESLVAEMLGGRDRGLLARPTIAADTLLTADEVGQALGVPVKLDAATMPGPLSTTTFRSADRKRAVLLMQLGQGTLAAMAFRSNSKGQQLTGIGDAAWQRGDRAVAKLGDTVVVLTLLGPGKGRNQSLPTLLQQALARIPAQRDPSP